jgi:hypothetical protein
MRILLASLFIVVLAFSQTNTGSITGTVFDPTQAVVPEIKISATNIDTNAVQATKSTSSGTYTIPALVPGTYRITVEAAGFLPLVRDHVVVETSRVVTLDLILSLEAASSQVTVRTDAPLVQDSNAAIQYGVNQKAVDELPLPAQSVIGVLEMIPGVVGDAGTEQAAITTGYTIPGTAISIAGSRMGSTQYKADGINNNSAFLGRISLSFSSDAIQEVSVQQNSYSAEYGRAGGGVVNMTTRSGGNQLRGTLFSFIQNDAFNAAPYSNTYREKGVQRFWRGGVDVGGPVWLPKIYNGRNRTFFFFGYEPLRQSATQTGFTRVPTELERNGDFSQSVYDGNRKYPVMIFRQFEFNPSGGLTNKRITLAPKTAYPLWTGNRIPASMVSPVSKKILSYFPMPNTAPQFDGNNFTAPRGVRNTDNRYLVKLDQAISNANRFSFRIASAPTRGDRYFLGGLSDWVAADASLGTNIAVNDTHVWGGNKVNELRAGFNRSRISRGSNALQTSQDWFKEFGLPSGLDLGSPRVVLEGFSVFGTDAGNSEIDNFFQLADIFNWTRGRHSIKAGFEFQAPQQNLNDLSAAQGTWTFNHSMTNIGSGDTGTYPGLTTPNAQTGFSIASFLLGFPNSVTAAPSPKSYQYRWKYYAGFVQDDIKLTPRLTVNLGLRYQIEQPRSEKHHNQGNYVNAKATNSQGQEVMGYVQLSGLGAGPATLFPTRYNSIEPRIGLAWRLPGDGLKWLKVVRSGYGISHVPTNGLFRQAIPNLNPQASQLASIGGVNGGWVQPDWNPLIWPKTPAEWPENGIIADLQSINTPAMMNQNVSMPYMQQWNFGLGFEFSRDLGFELNYVGSKGTQLFGPSRRYNTINLEEYTKQYLAGYNMNDRFQNPAGVKDANGNVITVTRQNMMRQNPLISSIADPLAQGDNSSYHALQAQLSKRFSHGLQFNVNYTFSKSIDTTSCEGQFCNEKLGDWSNVLPQLYGGDRKIERSVSTYDIPHVLRFSYNFDVPVGQGKWLMTGARSWVNAIVGNWKLGGIGSVQSGKPWYAFLGATAGWPDDVGTLRPNWNSGVEAINPDWRKQLNDPARRYAQYLDAQALFSPPALLTLGNSPRSISYVRMPRTETFNASILKEFPIHERTKLVFRAELFGALNHVNFIGNVNSNNLYQNLDYTRYTTPPVAAANIRTTFGDLSQNIGPTRTIQLGLKLYF